MLCQLVHSGHIAVGREVCGRPNAFCKNHHLPQSVTAAAACSGCVCVSEGRNLHVQSERLAVFTFGIAAPFSIGVSLFSAWCRSGR